MNTRQEIEQRDLRLIEKFRTIVKSKKSAPVKKTARQTGRFRLPLVCAGVVLIVAGAIVFRKQPVVPVPDTPGPPAIALEAPAVAREKRQASAAKVVVPVPMAKENLSQRTVPQPIEGPLNPVAAPVLNSGRSAETLASLPPAPAKQSPVRQDVQVSEIVSCTSVNQRQYVDAKTIFSLEQDAAPVVWMTVLSDNPPLVLIHVYYVNGRRYCEIPLEIRYPRMRTWSHVTLDPQHHTGQWRVEVMTGKGEKLAQVEFTIIK